MGIPVTVYHVTFSSLSASGRLLLLHINHAPHTHLHVNDIGSGVFPS